VLPAYDVDSMSGEGVVTFIFGQSQKAPLKQSLNGAPWFEYKRQTDGESSPTMGAPFKLGLSGAFDLDLYLIPGEKYSGTLAAAGGPLGLDFYRADLSGCVVAEGAPGPILGVRH